MRKTKVEMLLIEKEKNRQRISVLQKEKEDALTRVNELEIKETEMNRLLPRLTDSHVEWRDMALYRIMLNEEKKVLQDFIRDKDKELSVAATALAQVDKIVQEFDRKRTYDERYAGKELTGKITGISKHYEKRLRKSEVKLAGLSGTLADLQEALEKEKRGKAERDRLRPEVRAMEEKLRALEMSVSAEQNRAEEKLTKHLEGTAALSGELSALGMSVQSMQKQFEEYRAESEAVQREQKSIPAVMEEKLRALEMSVSAEQNRVEEKLSELLRKRSNDEKYIRKKLIRKITGISKHYEKRLRKSEVKLAGLSGTLADLQEALEKEKWGNAERDRLRPEVRAMEEKLRALEMSVSAEQNRSEEQLSKHLEDTAALSGELSALGMSVQSMQKQFEEYRAESEAVQREQKSIPAVMEEKLRALEMSVSAEQNRVEEKLSELLDDTLKLSDEIIALDMSFQSIIKQLQEYKIGSDMIQRGQKRLHVAIPVVYNEVSNAADKDMTYQQYGTTYDYSESGLSFYTQKPLFEGVGIDILCKGIWNEQRAGSVRWCKTIKYNLYLVGVSLQ